MILFLLKAPRLGEVKTRLARALGPRRAVQIYRRLVESQAARLPAGWPVEIHYAPRGARRELHAWLGSRGHFRVQRGIDLGARLVTAFAGAFARGASGALAIGGDCPGLDATRLRAAARALRRNDVVLGPACDGGYYLIGLRLASPKLFAGIPWSTGEVLRETRRRARQQGLRVHLLDRLEDVDDLASWRRAKQILAKT